MFDLGMMEILVIGMVALIVVGPKDLPGLFRTVGKFVGKMKGMAREFQRSMDDAAKASGMDDAMDGVKGAASGLKKATSFNPVDFNKDLGSMAKDSIMKNPKLDDDAKAAAVAKVDGDSGTQAKDGAAAKKPAKKPTAKTATKKPAAKKPATKKPAAQKSGAKKPAAKAASKKAPAKKPAAKKTTKKDA